jgi:hypothetical protein
MKEFSKDQLIQEFGKPGFAKIILIDKVRYLSGLNIFDTFIESKKLDGSKSPIYFEKYPNGFIIKLINGFSEYRTGIGIDCIKYFVIEQQEQLVSQKNKSVVGRALVGGLLLGPLGALVGGMSGVGSKSTKLTDYPDNILTVCIDNAGKEDYILFSVTNKHFQDVEKFLKTNFTTLYKNFNEIIKEEPKAQIETISIADEIRKLKELLDMGALSQEEFNEQKAKILNK